MFGATPGAREAKADLVGVGEPSAGLARFAIGVILQRGVVSIDDIPQVCDERGFQSRAGIFCRL